VPNPVTHVQRGCVLSRTSRFVEIVADEVNTQSGVVVRSVGARDSTPIPPPGAILVMRLRGFGVAKPC